MLKYAVLAMSFLSWSGPVIAQREASPGPNWVFQEGAYYGNISQVDPAHSDALFPININNVWGLMNQDGHIIAFPQFEWTDYGYDGLARAVIDGRTGFIAGDGDWVIQPMYDYADRFVADQNGRNRLAVVAIDDRWGMIDLRNELIIPLEYDGVLRFQDGMAGIEKDGLCGFADRRGRVTIPLQFKSIRSFHNGFAAVQLPDDRWGFIDKRGEIVWLDDTGRVVELGDFHEQYARVKVRIDRDTVRWGYLTKAFRFTRAGAVYEDARDFHNGMAGVRVEGKWGFAYANGRWAIEPQFDEVDDFDDAVGSNDFDEESSRDRSRRNRGRRGRELSTSGLYAMVFVDERWGYVNRAANAGLVPQFEWAEPFYLGLARVSRGDSFAYITETGDVRFDPESASHGIINRTGQERARQEAQRDNAARRNRIEAPPPPQRQTEVPYEAEYLYEERLPRPE